MALFHPASVPVYATYAIDANTCIISTSPANTFMYKTTNAGVSWVQVFTQVGGFIDDIRFSTATNGLAYGDPVASRWSIWRTTDAGSTWDSTGIKLMVTGTEAGWNNAMYMNGSSVYFGTNNTKIYYSTNGGTNWTAQPTTGELNSYSIQFNDASNGLMGGATMQKTTNGGALWATLTAPGTGNISGITGGGTNWAFVRQAAIIYGTTNNGTTWTTEFTAPAGLYYHIAKARTGTAVWACRSNGGITKWNPPVPVELTSFTASANNGSVILNWNTATETNNKGFEIQKKTANSEYITVAFVTGNGTSIESHDYSFTDSKLISGTYNYRLKQVDLDGKSTYSKAVEVEVINVNSFALDQNYPNPFNPTTNIRFNVANAGMVKLAVYNLLGQQVKTLVNEVKEAGTYNISFDASKLSSGTYFYKLETPEFSKTMKMTLSK